MRIAVAVVLLALLTVFWWSRGAVDAPRPVQAVGGAVHDATPEAAGSAAAPGRGATALERESAEPADAAADAFVSESENDGIVASPVRDGIVVLLSDAGRRPIPDASLAVRWRKGFGMYGWDRGRTDVQGRFATTIAEPEMVEGVVLNRESGDLACWSDLLPLADDPHTVLVVVPALAPVVVRVVDLAGAPVAAAVVTCECDRGDGVPREHWLMPEASSGSTVGNGTLELRLPAGRHEFRVEADGFEPIYRLRAAVPATGRTVTLHLLSRRGWHDVAVRVRSADGANVRDATVGGFVRELPAGLPGIEPDGIDIVQVQFEGTRRADGEFTLRAPPVPWRCWARDGDNWGVAEVGARDASVFVTLPAPAPKPMAQLVCKLVSPAGEPVVGEVMVHTTPDLAMGSRIMVRAPDPVVRVPAGGKACVSAWALRYPPCLVGPIDLKEGEQELVFQLREPKAIRGHVVDAKGAPVPVTVELRRPTGPLRTLAPDAPEFVFSAATGDSLATDDGRFWFENVGEGEHELWVRPEGVGWPARVRVQPGDENVLVRLGEGIADRVRIQGRVIAAGTGAPVVGARVRWLGDPWGGTVYTDADGRYAEAALPGELGLEVFARHFAVLQRDPRPMAAGLYTEDLVLQPSEPFFLRVRAADGVLPSLVVAAIDDRGREVPLLDIHGNYDGEQVALDADGRVRLYSQPLTAFRLRLRVRTNDDAASDRVPTMFVDVPANTRRDEDFVVDWQPGR